MGGKVSKDVRGGSKNGSEEITLLIALLYKRRSHGTA